MFHNKGESIHGRPAELRTHISHALNDGAETTIAIAWHISTISKYPTCAGEIGELLASDPQFTCDKATGQWRIP